MQKSLVFLYTKKSLKKIKKTILFTIPSKKIWYLRVNLTKEVKNIYTENYKILKKEIEEDTSTVQKYNSFNGLEEFVLLKYLYYSKQSIN